MTSTQVHLYSNTVIVEKEVEFTLHELGRVCSCSPEWLATLVDEGVLHPSGNEREEWRFSGPALRRARLAMRLTCELEVNLPGVALVIDLLEEIDGLRARLERSH